MMADVRIRSRACCRLHLSTPLARSLSLNCCGLLSLPKWHLQKGSFLQRVPYECQTRGSRGLTRQVLHSHGAGFGRTLHAANMLLGLEPGAELVEPAVLKLCQKTLSQHMKRASWCKVKVSLPWGPNHCFALLSIGQLSFDFHNLPQENRRPILAKLRRYPQAQDVRSRLLYNSPKQRPRPPSQKGILQS